MDETELITTLQSRLSSALSEPVRTSGMEDERPVPVVIIDDWNTTDKNFHNTARSGSAYGDFDGDGSKEYEWYLTFDFSTRVEIEVRHHDEVEVSRLKEQVKQELRLIRENPLNFHPDMKQCKLGSGGNPSYNYTEPKEAELKVSARFHGDHTITRTPSDTEYATIESVTDSFTFNP
jgi:hypothetical protein